MGSALPILRGASARLRSRPESTIETGNHSGVSIGALTDYHAAMSRRLGPMNWWPAKTPFEVIVGAILTQNTAWTNVERAIENLRKARLLTQVSIERVQ